MKNQKTVRVALYVRVSTIDQAKEGHSIEGQINSLKAKIDSEKENGWEYSDRRLYVDEGVSGADESRPELDRMKQDIEQGKVDVVLVWKIDRLFRRTQYLLELVSFFQENGVKFVSKSEQIDTATTHGRLVLTLLGAIAEMERETIAERTILGKITRAEQGFYVGGAIPYGYRISDEKKLIVEPNEAKVVKKIFDLYVKQGKSQQAIANELTSLQIPVKSDSQNGKRKNLKNIGKWGASTVGDILSHTHYIGKYYYNRYEYKKGKKIGEKPKKEWIVFECEPLIDNRIFERAQELKRINKANAKPKGKGRYLLAGLIRCGECGYSFQGYPASKKPNIYYRCKGRYGKKTDCKIKQISGLLVEKFVWELVTDMLGNPKNFANYLQNKPDTNRNLKKYKKELKELTEKEEKLKIEIGNLLENSLGGEITRKIAKSKIEEKEKMITTITEFIKETNNLIASEESKEGLEESIEKLSEIYSEKIENMSQEDRHKLLTILISKILVFEDKVEVYFKFNLQKPKVMKLSGKKKCQNPKIKKNNYSGRMSDHLK